ncbi:MAG TPA: hypothetical protein PKA00_11390 [Saprospiraceae bacterium]|nr:hypothetical protein [Saprospiraceae bacterium]HMQ83506.1 hypothetical protein [Saprospiraceae bacterium]
MRLIYLYLLLFWLPAAMNGQKVLQIETYGKAKTEKIYIGTPITFRLQGTEEWQTAYIEDLRLEDSLVVLPYRYVKLHEIDAFRYNRPWTKPVSTGLLLFGASWSGFAAIGFYTDGDPATSYRPADAIVSLSSIGLSFAIRSLFKHKTIHFGKRKRLRMLDLRFKVESWED